MLGALALGAGTVLALGLVGGYVRKRLWRLIPNRMRGLLTAENGANDGLALLFVTLPILFLARAPVEALSEWLMRVRIWEVLGGVSTGSCWGGWLANFWYGLGASPSQSAIRSPP
ncbi:Sodium/hydrogen exchanger (fragment) [Mesorhizobium plurifarium]|uniref:Sodium/hydrogen exchanger n=1 Tax=Mesorhizobium plurifarium TaxID=69974 RepID=A0A090FXL0_MESPL